MSEILIISIYFLIIFLIGLLTSRYSDTKEKYFLANQELGLLTTTASLTATGIGGSATIASLIYVYKYGVAGIWMNLSAALGLFFLGFFYAAKIRKLKVYSLPEVVGQLYDEKTRYMASLLILFIQIAWLALLIQATQLILKVVVDFDPDLLLVIATVIFVLYTFLGGQFAVSYSDVFQFLLMIFGVFGLAVPGMLKLSGGEALFQKLPPSLLDFPFSSQIGPGHVFSLFLLMGLSHMVGPDIYAKILSAKSDKVARRAAFISGGFRIIWGVAIGILGLAAIYLLPKLQDTTLILPSLLAYFSDPIIKSVIVAAFLATMMSSADTVLLTGATIFTNDVLPRLQKKAPKSLLGGKIFMVAAGISGLLLALYFKDIIKTLELAYTVFAAGLIPSIMLGFFKKPLRINSHGAFIAMICGGGFALLLKFKVIQIFLGIHEIIPGMAMSLGCLFLFSWIKGMELKKKKRSN